MCDSIIVSYILKVLTGGGDVDHSELDGYVSGQVGAPVWRAAVVLNTRRAEPGNT